MGKRRKLQKIEVEPEIIKWVLRSSGWNKNEIIKKLKINNKTYDGWLRGTIKPTLRQLETLSKYLKRPVAVFFLPEPPKEKPLPPDYRMLPEKSGHFEKKTLLAIRKARRLQRIGKELSKNLEQKISPDITNFKLTDNPRTAGKECRKLFGVSIDIQKKWRTPYDAFNKIRELIEDKNIFVFQLQMPLEDARGFTLIDDKPVVIVINSSDIIEAKIFTILHELGHVLLNKPGISIPENALVLDNVDKVEKWCNDFASEFILPQEIAKKEFKEYKNVLLEGETLKKLSKKYKVSKSMLIYNMAKFGFINKNKYNKIFENFKSKKMKSVRKFALSHTKRRVRETGHKFPSLVFDNLERGLITHSDAVDYLSTKVKHLDKISSQVKK